MVEQLEEAKEEQSKAQTQQVSQGALYREITTSFRDIIYKKVSTFAPRVTDPNSELCGSFGVLRSQGNTDQLNDVRSKAFHDRGGIPYMYAYLMLQLTKFSMKKKLNPVEVIRLAENRMKSRNRDITAKEKRITLDSLKVLKNEAAEWEDLYEKSSAEWIRELNRPESISLLRKLQQKRKINAFLTLSDIIASSGPSSESPVPVSTEEWHKAAQKRRKANTTKKHTPWSIEEANFLLSMFQTHGKKHDRWKQISDLGIDNRKLHESRNQFSVKDKWRSIFERCHKASKKGESIVLNCADGVLTLSKERVCWIAKHGGLRSRARGCYDDAIGEADEEVVNHTD